MSAVPMNSTAVSTSVAAKNSFVWLIKRELWEHRKFFVAPLIVAAIYIIALIVNLARMDNNHVSVVMNGIEIAKASDKIESQVLDAFLLMFSTVVTWPFFLVTFFVTFFYTLDALYADRRDRSFLFWKSLPVSDVETVASKLAIAAVVAPAITAVVALVTQYVCLILVSIVMLFKGHSATQLWVHLPVIKGIAVMLYSILVIGIWSLPIWAWFLMVSSWANRMPFLWSLVPVAVLAFLEYLTLDTHRVLEFLGVRFAGWYFVAADIDALAAIFKNPHPPRGFDLSDILTPGAYFSSPDLWIGLGIAAVFLATAVWMRRYRTAA